MPSLLTSGFLELRDYMGTETSIVNSARISYASMSKTGSDTKADTKLLKYLWTNKHTTPFESCVLTFHIKAPIFVVRQWHRHRMFSYNEVSARYTEVPDEYYIPEASAIGVQSTSSKQARVLDAEVDSAKALVIQDSIAASNIRSFESYEKLLNLGVARELARSVLPLGTFTEFLATGNLHSWLHFLKLRLHPHAQYEIRVYAEEIQKILTGLYPNLMEVFNHEIANQTSK